MLRKIDCILVRVPDLDRAADFYTTVFGLRRRWHDATSVALGMPETDAEIVLHTMDLPPDVSAHYLVDHVDSAVTAAVAGGASIRVAPFDIPVGRCAVLSDPYGNAVCLVDLTRGRRTLDSED